MTFHVWGDSWEHWDELNNAIGWIIEFYERATGEHLICKEKYGTMRYEMTHLYTGKKLIILLDIIRRATLKFKNVAPELVDDMLDSLIPCNAEIATYYGYFQAVLDHCPDTSLDLEELP